MSPSSGGLLHQPLFGIYARLPYEIHPQVLVARETGGPGRRSHLLLRLPQHDGLGIMDALFNQILAR